MHGLRRLGLSFSPYLKTGGRVVFRLEFHEGLFCYHRLLKGHCPHYVTLSCARDFIKCNVF